MLAISARRLLPLAGTGGKSGFGIGKW